MKELFEKFYNEIVENNGFDNDIVEFWNNLVKSALEYTNMRVNWSFMNLEEKVIEDSHRTVLHNSFINNLKIFVRYCEQKGRNLNCSEFIDQDRKILGDFANYIVFRVATLNR